MNVSSRLPHVVSDPRSRVMKARKIEILVGEERLRRARRILESGTGSGLIADYLGGRYPDACVTGTDVVDGRVQEGRYDFLLLEGNRLPFPDGYFDIVISNHVLEHVGDEDSQISYLSELNRVLSPEGVAYLAIPNRWSPYESHFRLPFLSWPTQRWRNRLVRTFGRGTHYDCEPRSASELRHLFSVAGFEFDDVTLKALATMLSVEYPRRVPAWLARVIARLAVVSYPIIPTYAFILKRNT